MTIDTINKDGDLFVTLDGRLDSTTAGDLEAEFEKNLFGNVKSLTIDMKKVDFISSKGIRVLVAAYRKIGEKDLTITGANDSIKEIFRISGLLKIFNIE